MNQVYKLFCEWIVHPDQSPMEEEIPRLGKGKKLLSFLNQGGIWVLRNSLQIVPAGYISIAGAKFTVIFL